MVGIVSGNGLGLFNTSQDVLGLAIGQTSLDQTNGKANVNNALLGAIRQTTWIREPMKFSTTLLTTALTTALAFSLVACGGGSTQAPAASSSTAAITSTAAASLATSSASSSAAIVAKPWAEVLSPEQSHTIQGDVSIIANFPMPQLNRSRRIWIYLPAGYQDNQVRYPVLYMHDGQNIFDDATSFVGEWGVDEALLQMEQEDSKLKTIVVGIDNGGLVRASEYHSSSYADFIVETLKPYIDSHYRTLDDREHTAIAGSSFGGYISLYTGIMHQEIFGKIAAFSNVDDGTLPTIIAQRGKLQELQIYIDAGQIEDSQFPGIIASNQSIYNGLLLMGFSAQQVSYVKDPLGAHNETAWKRRFPNAWKWLNP